MIKGFTHGHTFTEEAQVIDESMVGKQASCLIVDDYALRFKEPTWLMDGINGKKEP